MKVGIEINPSSGYHRFGDEKYNKMFEHGYRAVDYDLSNTNTDLYVLSINEARAKLKTELSLIKAAGMAVSQVHGPWRWPPRDSTEKERSERMEKMKRSFELTVALDCKNWVIHPIMPYGLDDARTENAQKTWNLNVRFMLELLKAAKEYDITICLENMPMQKFSISKPKQIYDFVKLIDDDHFKVCLDTGHAAVFDDMSAGDAVRLFGNELKVLHVHDTCCGSDLHLMPYNGVVDWPDFAKALGEISFDGVLSLETTPSVQLDDDMFSEMCMMQAKLAWNMTETAKQ